MLTLKERFEMSEEYKVAFAEYKRRVGNVRWAEGVLLPFVRDTFVENKDGRVKASRVKELYDVWAEQTGAKDYSMRKLGEGLKSLLESRRMSDGVYYFGIKEVDGSHDMYRIYSNESGKTDKVNRTITGVLAFAKDYWKIMNKGVIGMPEEPDHINEQTVEEELGKLGFRIESLEKTEGED